MPVALVTGASRGVGKGIATALLPTPAMPSSPPDDRLEAPRFQPQSSAIPCDHTDDAQTAAAFARISSEASAIDVVANAAWGGYERMVEDGRFTRSVPFWEQPAHRWSGMMDAGVPRRVGVTSQAVRLMLPARRGLVVNISFWPARKYIGNALYGVAKAATDKLTSDMAHELRPHDIAVVSLYPGLLRTEAVLAAAEWLDLSNSESPEFIGRVIASLAGDERVLERSGRALVAASLAAEFGIADADGRRPTPLTLGSV